MSAETKTMRPDLFTLPRAVRVRIAVAVYVYGARWNESAVECWLGGLPVVMTDTGGAVYATGFLPDYLTDPAAWGPLLREQLCGVHQSGPDGPWKGQWWDEAKLKELADAGVPMAHARASIGLFVGPICPTLAEAVCAAVLARHGIDWLTLEPVPQ